MLLVGRNSWIQSSVGNETQAHREDSEPKRQPGVARAALMTGLVALALMAGVAHPAETAAYKSESLVCTSIEAGFQYTFDKALTAKLAGDTKGFEYWNTIAQAAQGLWYDAGCGVGSGGWRAPV